MNERNIVQEYEFFKPEIDEIAYLLVKVLKDCKKKFFHTYIYRCVYDNNFTNKTNNEKVILNISHDCLEIKSEYYELNKKNQNSKS